MLLSPITLELFGVSMIGTVIMSPIGALVGILLRGFLRRAVRGPRQYYGEAWTLGTAAGLLLTFPTVRLLQATGCSLSQGEEGLAMLAVGFCFAPIVACIAACVFVQRAVKAPGQPKGRRERSRLGINLLRLVAIALAMITLVFLSEQLEDRIRTHRSPPAEPVSVNILRNDGPLRPDRVSAGIHPVGGGVVPMRASVPVAD